MQMHLQQYILECTPFYASCIKKIQAKEFAWTKNLFYYFSMEWKAAGRLSKQMSWKDHYLPEQSQPDQHRHKHMQRRALSD
jgi:hypothetical protein